MAQENAARARWMKPLIIGMVVAALAIGGYVTMRETPLAAAPAVTFVTIKGEKIPSQSLRGKVVMVNFWATSCVSCVREMPQMVETYNKFNSQGLEFVAVAMNYDRPDHVINFAEKHKLPFTVALDSGGDIAKAFNDVTMTPTTFVIDRDGNIIKRYVGEPDFAAVHLLLQGALAQKAAG
ncbi:redoxin family protein [Massilia sp. PAMC28688]|uniref:peroxiredoxin family protein n=1 Tax=Massilia sp. PAMC28688 TaxID=2861283 RepID=UPI001C62E54D|nr:TlpA disulfide reductase family protein [Massilia sp. PAMC28688]QYF95264.1 redoxin family protein [Massilia sp. PAMC28688]